MNLSKVSLIVTWFDDAEVIARALGLDITLPDVNSEDPAYWAKLDIQEWRTSLKGKVAMSPEEIDMCDPDWVLLKKLDHGVEVWFDIEEGVRFICEAGDISYLVGVIRETARVAGLLLSQEGTGAVWASQTGRNSNGICGKDLAPIMVPAGFSWDKHHWKLIG